MTANHAPGCPAIADVRDGCSCLLRGAAAQGHLPDCNDATDHQSMEFGGLCICPQLRACEARVRDEMTQPDPGIDEIKAYAAAVTFRNGRDVGYAAALDAAREAVPDSICTCLVVGDENPHRDYCAYIKAIDAIAALKATP